MGEGEPIFFSVIMPVYNHARYVGEAIDSVIAQTWPHWELICVDDGSIDESPRILDEYAAREQRIKVIHQANTGHGPARNNAMKQAKGPWIAWLDSDDLWYPHALASYVEYIQAHPEATFIQGFRDRLNPDGSITKSEGEFQDRITGAEELFGRMFLSHLCVTYRKELIERVGGYDPDFRTAPDYDLYLRMTPYTKFWPLGKSTGLRRRHDSNISRASGRTRMTHAAILERFVSRYGGAKALPADLVSRRLSKVYYAAGKQYVRELCFRQAVGALRRSRNYRPRVKATALLLLARLLSWTGREDRAPLPKA